MSKTSGNLFKSKFTFVKPLYRKARINDCENIDNSGNPYNVDRTVKLCGNDFNVKTVIASGTNINIAKHKQLKDYKVVLPGVCDRVRSVDDLKHLKVIDILRSQRNNNNVKRNINFKSCGNKMLTNDQDEAILKDDISERNSRRNNLETNARATTVPKVPETWLRVYPAPNLPEETILSTILRCILCQLGLITFLVLWTILGVFLIESFEGPQEMRVSTEFEKEQNQLVIDLATELRQITPLSRKWRNAIEKRIEEERKLTIAAVGEGAMLQPGQFWNLPGTFLFAVYVMTALGFGAPVPHTVWGRTSALMYAVLAVPTHIYLMVNASTCVVVHMEEYTKYLKENYYGKIDVTNDVNKQEITKLISDNTISSTATLLAQRFSYISYGSYNSFLAIDYYEDSLIVDEDINSKNNQNSESMKSSNKLTLRKNLNRCISLFAAGRCVPLASITYYLIGVISFGVLRNKPAFESIMFPIEFTTTGGLDRVEGFVRIFYGIYIEGAMCLFACALATVRRHNSSTFEHFSHTYRLFEREACKNSTDNKEGV